MKSINKYTLKRREQTCYEIIRVKASDTRRHVMANMTNDFVRELLGVELEIGEQVDICVEAKNQADHKEPVKTLAGFARNEYRSV